MYFAQNGTQLIAAAILNTLDGRYWKNVAVPSQNLLPVDTSAKQVAPTVWTYVDVRSVRTNLNQVAHDKGVNESEEDESNNDIMDLLEELDGVDEDDLSDVEIDYNEFEQDYAYVKDDHADDELLELFEMINNDEGGYSVKEDMVNALLAWLSVW